MGCSTGLTCSLPGGCAVSPERSRLCPMEGFLLFTNGAGACGRERFATKRHIVSKGLAALVTAYSVDKISAINP